MFLFRATDFIGIILNIFLNLIALIFREVPTQFLSLLLTILKKTAWLIRQNSERQCIKTLAVKHYMPSLGATSPLCKEYVSVEGEGQNTT